MNQFFLCIFFLILNCEAISVSQLERLQKARKGVTIALHEYNDVINQNMAQITVWKKKIEDFVKIIASIDPDGAKKLQETMIEPTLQAVDRVVKEREAGQSLLFKSKGMPEEVLESKVIEPKKPNSEIQQTVSKKNVAQKSKKDFVQKEEQKKKLAIVPVEHQILTQPVEIKTPDLPVLQSVSKVSIIAQQPTQFPIHTIKQEPVRIEEPQKVIIAPVESVQSTQPTIPVGPVANTVQKLLLPTESHEQTIEPPVEQLQEPKTEKKVVQSSIESPSQLPESLKPVITPIKKKKVKSKELTILPVEHQILTQPVEIKTPDLPVFPLEFVSKVSAIAQQPTQFPVLTIKQEPVRIEEPQKVIIIPVESVQSTEPTISVGPVANTVQKPLLATESHEQTIEPPVEQLKKPETEEKVLQSSIESPSQLPESQETVPVPVKEKKVKSTVPKLPLQKVNQSKREKSGSKRPSDLKVVTKKSTSKSQSEVLENISQTIQSQGLSLIPEEQEVAIFEVPSKPKAEQVPLAAEESNVNATAKKTEPAIPEVSSTNTIETVPLILENEEYIDDSIFGINSV